MSLAVCAVCGIDHPMEEHPAHDYVYTVDASSLEDLCCPISMQPLVEPHDVPCCGQTISAKALFDHLKIKRDCPMCRSPITAARVHQTSRLVRQKLDALQIVCPHCNVTCTREQLRDHLQKCPLAPLRCAGRCKRIYLRCATGHSCASACANCPSIAAANAGTHAERCEFLGTPCPRCRKPIPPRLIDVHARELCPCRKVTCPGPCGTHMLARELPAHKCVDVMVEGQKAFVAKEKRRMALGNAQIKRAAAAAEMYKVVLIGDSGVGKTALLDRHQNPTKELEGTVATVGFDYQTVEVKVSSDQILHLQVWDTAGQERFQSLTQGYFRHTAALLLAFDYSKSNTLEHTNLWMELAIANRDAADPAPVVLLVGCKSDLQQPAAGTHVSDELAEGMVQRLKAVGVVKTSARTGEGIMEIFPRLGAALVAAGIKPQRVGGKAVNVNASEAASSSTGTSTSTSSGGCCS
eukprot:m.28551 g.28551  ORF g.28551 m.28551 type:complete len:465 (-) comp9088_c0_seq1:65-1459(-)